MEEVTFRTCAGCVMHLPTSCFYKQSGGDGLNPRCKECVRWRSKKWKADNYERHRENSRRWAAEHPEKLREYLANQDPEKKSAWHQAYYLANRDTIRARVREWQRAHHEYVIENVRNRKFRKRGAFVEMVRRDYLAKKTDWKCGICGDPIDRTDWTVDHIIPLSKGGEHSYANTQIAHLLCNLRKGVKVPA